MRMGADGVRARPVRAACRLLVAASSAALAMAGCGTADGERTGAVEQDVGGAGGWANIGPKGAIVRYGSGGGGANPVRYTGPIMDIELRPAYFARIAAEGGGTFQKALNGTITPLSDDMCGAVNCLTTSTIATDPDATWRWLVGTSAVWQANPPDGQGVWLWDAVPAIWRNVVPRADAGRNVYRIRFAPTAAAVVFAATSRGVWMSQSSGAELTWSKVLPYSGDIDTTDLVTVREGPSTTGVWVVSRGGGGPWYAQYTSGGLSAFVFRPIDCTTGCDLAGSERQAVTVSPANPSRVYVQVGARDGALLGIYRSDSAGASGSWVNVTPVDPLTRQYDKWNNVIGASPVDSGRLLACGYQCFWSTSAGAAWTKMDGSNIPDWAHLHNDHHAIAWSADGASVAVGNDGGFTWGTNANGAGPPSWDTYVHNVFPIIEFVRADRTGAAAPNVFLGAAWHDGTTATDDGGNTWYLTRAGDAYEVLADVANTGRAWATDQSADWRSRSNDWGTTTAWTKIPLAPQVLPVVDQAPRIAHDNVNPVWLYANSESQVWRSTDFEGGNSFTQLGTIPGAGSVRGVAVHKYPSLGVYATRNVGSTDRFWVYEGGAWSERSNTAAPDAWPANDFINRVVVQPDSQSVAYVLLSAANGDVNRRVYRTPNRGIDWVNITGNLPTFIDLEAEIYDLAVDPVNPANLFLATSTGVFFSGVAGYWQPWNWGWPAAVMATSIRADLIGGSVWVTAGTYGRGLWVRDPRRGRPR